MEAEESAASSIACAALRGSIAAGIGGAVCSEA